MVGRRGIGLGGGVVCLLICGLLSEGSANEEGWVEFIKRDDERSSERVLGTE